MTTQAARKKQEKKRALKKKHEHLTEEMAERHAKKKRAHTEEWVAIIAILAIAPFLVFGIIWWPAEAGRTEHGDLGLPDGDYYAAYLDSQPDSGAALLVVNGKSYLVTESDLSGEAARDSGAFFKGQQGEQIEITVEDGYISGFSPSAFP